METPLSFRGDDRKRSAWRCLSRSRLGSTLSRDKRPQYRAIRAMYNPGRRPEDRIRHDEQERLHQKVQAHPNILSLFDVFTGLRNEDYKFFVFEMMDARLFDIIS